MRSKENNDGDPDCTEVLEEGSRSILMGIISQLSKNMDLHRGVKKPYNPVLGELFRCQWNYDDGTSAFYIAEQVSHHPPISTYFYGSPENGIFIQGNIRPKSRFLGNSVASLMEGDSYITFTELHNERYDFTMPNMYARGILFGKMVLELGDSCFVRCRTSDLVCELDFKTKGIFSGQYNSLAGKVKKESTGEVLFEISGQWSGEIYLKTPKASSKSTLFDVKTATVIPKKVAAENLQESNESRRLWSKVTKAMAQNDMDAATDEKIAIEDKQREDAKYREEKMIQWKPRYFKLVNKDQYEFKGIQSINFKSPHGVKQLESMLFDNQTPSAVQSQQNTNNGMPGSSKVIA
ncbi:hypothetical protein DFQ29_000368 [Apophysomyces sp. BC1021]|nr:hypothetical protein DFQ29_000368 [Apophysomyces sp. BC1021]